MEKPVPKFKVEIWRQQPTGSYVPVKATAVYVCTGTDCDDECIHECFHVNDESDCMDEAVDSIRDSLITLCEQRRGK